jgi:hypothetical protein
LTKLTPRPKKRRLQKKQKPVIPEEVTCSAAGLQVPFLTHSDEENDQQVVEVLNFNKTRSLLHQSTETLKSATGTTRWTVQSV